MFAVRHKTLFNLYAFDPMSTINSSPPKLQLKNCDFKYFVNTHDSLINVENNNLGYVGLSPDENEGVEDRTMTYYGTDRGAVIEIIDSNFYSNSFCKGLINYSKFQSISYQEQPQMLNFTANFAGVAEVAYEEPSQQSHISIMGSSFWNTGFHQVIQALQRLNVPLTARSSEPFAQNIAFRKNLHQGLILKTEGFPGTITVKKSLFFQNMAYIQQILLSEDLQTKTEYDFDDIEMYIQFKGFVGSTHIQFKVCVDNLWTSKYLFQDSINPNEQFDDALVVANIETVAPFVIIGNQGPIVFVGNTFRENIGTTGGVIHIQDPDFRYSNLTGLNPYIVINDNQFKRNMAYWAGNAFHITMTMQMVDGYLSGKSDAMQTCGAGIAIKNNYFGHNIGFKRHNGGVGVVRCGHST